MSSYPQEHTRATSSRISSRFSGSVRSSGFSSALHGPPRRRRGSLTVVSAVGRIQMPGRTPTRFISEASSGMSGKRFGSPEVQPERDTGGIDRPETKRGGLGFDAGHERALARHVVGGEIPRHPALGLLETPLQVPIASLPVIAEEQRVIGEAGFPPEQDTTE